MKTPNVYKTKMRGAKTALPKKIIKDYGLADGDTIDWVVKKDKVIITFPEHKVKLSDLVGKIELPLAVGIVGGAANIHPKARLSRKILGVKTAGELAEIIASLGLAQNFAALFALSTVGIQKGHMTLHAKNIAVMAGAAHEEIDKISQKMIKEKNIKLDRAEELLKKLRGT